MSLRTTTTDAAWAAARAAMLLDPTIANLNTGSFGPTSRAVFERVMSLRRRLAEEPMDFLLRESPPLLWHARERLADFLGTAASRLAFTVNVTAAINIIASGLRLTAPGEVLMSDREYGSMQWTWERAARRQGLSIRTFHLPLMPRDAGEIVDAVRAALTPRTRLLHFSHVLSATGLVLPAKELCELARQHGVVSVIDGAHAPCHDTGRHRRHWLRLLWWELPQVAPRPYRDRVLGRRHWRCASAGAVAGKLGLSFQSNRGRRAG